MNLPKAPGILGVSKISAYLLLSTKAFKAMSFPFLIASCKLLHSFSTVMTGGNGFEPADLIAN